MSILVVKSNDLHCFRSRFLKKADGTLSCTLNLVEGHLTEEIFSKNVKKIAGRFEHGIKTTLIKTRISSIF